MPADENVDLKFTADGSAAQTTLEQIAASLQRIGEKGLEAGKKHEEGMGWASKGIEEFTGGMLAAVSAGALFEKTLDAVAENAGVLEKRMQDAADAITRAAAGQHGWLDFLRPGDRPAAIERALDDAADRTHAPVGAMDQIFAAAIQGAAATNRQVSTSELLAEAEAAAGTTPVASVASQRAMMIGKLRQFRPEFTASGAMTEIMRTGGSGKVQELVEGLTPGTHDSYQTLSSFAEAVVSRAPEGVESNTLLRMVQQMIRGEEKFTGSHAGSLGEALDFLRNDPRGKIVAQEMQSDSQKGGLGGRSAQLGSILKGIVGGQFALPQGGVPNAPVPGVVSLQSAIEDLTTQGAEESMNDSERAEELFRRKDPQGLAGLASRIRAKWMESHGDFGERMGEKTHWNWLFSPKGEVDSDVKQMQTMLHKAKGDRPHFGWGGDTWTPNPDRIDSATQRLVDDNQKQLDVLQRIAALLERVNNRDAKTNSDGDVVPATAIQQLHR